MMVELQLWQLISLLITFIGFGVGVLRYLFAQMEKRNDERGAEAKARWESFQKDMDSRFSSIETSQKTAANEWTRLERSIFELKAELPEKYVRREDYVRGQSVLEAKMDALYSKLETIFLQGKSNGR